MSIPSTVSGYYRQTGTNDLDSATPAVFPAVIQFTFDPTAASADTGAILPSGAIPIFSHVPVAGATGGTNPTVDIGTAADADGFGNELDADTYATLAVSGALLGTALTADTAIYAGVGASAATGGSCTGAVWYIMADDGSVGR